MDADGGTYLWNLSKLPLEPKPWLPDEECLQVVATSVAAGDRAEVAALTGRAKVLVFAPNGSNGQALDVDAKDATTIALAPDGRSLAVGFADGTVVWRDLVAGNDVTQKGPGAVTRLELSNTGALAIGRVSGVHLLRAGRLVALTDWSPERLAFSADGRFLAACAAATGAARVWQVDEEAQSPRTVLAEDDARAARVCFTADNATLLTGATDGSLETWRIEGDKGVRGWHVAASRGKVRQAVPAPTRRLLALLNDSNEAQVLDLEGRVCRRVPGRWTSATFLDDDRLLATAAIDAPKHAGDVLAIDAKTFQINDLHFARTSDRYNVSPEVVFERVSISPDRSRVAATASVDQTPLVVLWDAKTGRLTHALTHLEDPVRCLSFSKDGRWLLTSGDGPSADLWDLSRAEGELDKSSASCTDPAGRHVTQSLIRPGAESKLQVVTGHSDGRVSLWSYKAPELELVASDFTLGAFSRAILALAFSNDGNTLAVAGDANTIWLGDFTGRPKALPDFAERPQHFEQINALAVWPGTTGQGMLISASDDATVRFWDIAGRTLKGTFRAAVLDPEVEKLPVPILDWVLYTPEGRFDASDGRAAIKVGDAGGKEAVERRLDAAEGGRALVRFRLRDDPRSLAQFDASLFTFQLGEKLLTNEIIPPPRKLEEPPLITIDPPNRPDDSKPSAVLTLNLNAADVKDVRLYHNGVPVPCGVDVEGRTSASRKIQVPVRLLKGVNRFYAMAGRATTYDSRSADIELEYDGVQAPGQVHIVALGVGDYHRNRRLKYPRNDALSLSDVLEERSKREGLTIIRTDDEVTEANVKDAFDKVAVRVKDRPQDTVVVFLAGHTGIFNEDRFCLLLPNFPFPPGGPELVAARDAPPIDPKTELRPEHLLAYEVVARQFRKLGALRRLVIVDACQAEAILSDPRVKKIQEWMEIGSRKARTAYLMAARQGEPALEVDPLRHGLFTYSLLHGLGKIQPADEPEEIRKLSLPVDADFDKDGEVTTGELDAYVRDALPRITSVFPDLVTRRRAVEVPAPRVGPAEVLARETSLQSARVSFPLVPVR
jgi:WD40 repeat protein